jgi:hypothetical protein
MLALETPAEGRMFNGPGGQFWLSPQSNLAFCYPTLIARAFEYLESVGHEDFKWITPRDYKEQLGKLSSKLVKFIDKTANTQDNMRSIVEELDFTEIPLSVRTLFGYALMQVVNSYYFHSFRETNDEAAYGFAQKSIEQILELQKSKSWWSRKWKAFLNLIRA